MREKIPGTPPAFAGVHPGYGYTRALSAAV